MSHPTHLCRDPRVVADLFDLIAAHDLAHALNDIEELLARLREDAEDAEAARELLRATPTEVLREGLRLRAARRIEPVR